MWVVQIKLSLQLLATVHLDGILFDEYVASVKEMIALAEQPSVMKTAKTSGHDIITTTMSDIIRFVRNMPLKKVNHTSVHTNYTIMTDLCLVLIWDAAEKSARTSSNQMRPHQLSQGGGPTGNEDAACSS